MSACTTMTAMMTSMMTRPMESLGASNAEVTETEVAMRTPVATPVASMPMA